MALPVFSEHDVRMMASTASFFKGKKYFEENAVGVVEVDGDSYWAKVTGSRPYRVTVYGKAGDVHAECTCPYHYGGICKHAVATMLKIIERGPVWRADSSLSPEEMIRRMNKSELEGFVIDLIGLNDGVLDLLRAHYPGGDNRTTVKDYMTRVAEAFSDRDLSAYNTKNVFERLQPIDRLAHKLQGEGDYLEAAKVFEALFEGVARNVHRVEDSYGVFSEIASAALRSLTECVRAGHFDDAARRRYIRKLLKSYERVRYGFFNDDYRDAILTLADEADLEHALEVLNGLIAEYVYDSDEVQLKYYYRHAVRFALAVLVRLGRTDELAKLARANSDDPEAILVVARAYASEGRPDEALIAAEDGLNQLGVREGEELGVFVAEALEDRGELAHAAHVYRDLFIAHDSFEYYERARRLALHAGLWSQVFGSIIVRVGRERIKAEKTLCEIYLREGAYEEAFLVAMRSHDVSVLELVAETIKASHPGEAYELYRQLVDIYLDEHIGRPAYQQAVAFLEKMKELGFDREFYAYLDELSRRFPRRRALLDEMHVLSA